MKTALITGVSGNLGQAVAKKFLTENWRVAGTVILNDPVKLEVSGEHLQTATTNLTDEELSGTFIRDIVAKNGSINAAILTVGGFAMGAIADTRISDINKQYKLNFETAYNIARPVFMHMIQNGYG